MPDRSNMGYTLGQLIATSIFLDIASFRNAFQSICEPGLGKGSALTSPKTMRVKPSALWMCILLDNKS